MPQHVHAPLPPRPVFLRRAARHAVLPLLFILVALGIGIVGYHLCGGLGWLDALVNASMILAGMGPVDPIVSVRGKLFASFYALFSGVAFLTTVAVLISPLVHRLMHRFHVEVAEPGEPAD